MQPYRLKRTAQPTLEPVTAFAALEHIRTDSALETNYVEGLIATAREWCETYTQSTVLTSTWQLTLDCFPEAASLTARRGYRDTRNLYPPIALPRGPVQSVTSIVYLDEDNAQQTLDSSLYTLDNASEYVARVVPAVDQEWPDTIDHINAVTVTFVAGYTAPALVPPRIVHAVKLLVGHWFENREAIGNVGKEIEFTVQALLAPHRLGTVG